MRSAEPGTSTSAVELANVSPHGFWLLIDDREHYLPFDAFPWFRDATIGQLSRVERPSREHLHWPDLEVDLTMDSIERPDAYPLVSRARPGRV
jgi:hypothetical protein